MNRTLQRTGPKLLLVVATAGVGVVAGRAAQPADSSAPTGNPAAVAAGSAVSGTLSELDVLAPVAIGSTQPEAPTDDESTMGLGEIIGVASAVTPGSPSSEGPQLPEDEPGDLSTPSPVAPVSPLDSVASATPALGGGVEPLDVVLDALALEPSDPSGDAGGDSSGDPGSDLGLRPYVDPCAPPPDSGTDAAADCPEGARSTVLPIVSLGDAYVSAQQVGHAAARGASCPETSPDASGGAVLEVLTNAPASLRIDVLDVAGRNGNVGTFVESTAPADVTSWDTSIAAGVDPNQLSSLIVHCVELDGLPANASLVALVRSTRAVDGDIAYDLLTLTSTPAALRPPTIVVPVGANRVLVSIAHQRGQRATLDAWVSPDGVATCEPAGRFPRLWTSIESTAVADVNALRARGYNEAYRLRTTAVFWVPEGRSINVCARTFDNSGPSFRMSQPVQQDSTVVHSPDMVVPVVSVDSISTNTNLVGADMRVTLSWARGTACGYFAGTFNEANTIDPPEYDNTCDGGSATSAAGHASDVVVTTGLRTPAMADVVETNAVLPVRARACVGGDSEGFGAACPTLPTEWYRVPLATVPVRTGICSPGLFETTCEPPTRDQVAGVVQLRVDWVTGGSSGRSSWLVEPIVSGGRRTELAPTPQLDLTRVATVTGEGTRQTANLTLLADRPVDWELTVPDSTCRREGAAAPVWRSTSPSTQFTTRADGFCTGVWVQFIVTLTDPATGASATYGRWPDAWAGGYVHLPASLRALTVQVGIGAPDDLYPLWTPDDVFVQIGRPESVDFLNPWGGRYDFPLPLQRDRTLRCQQSYRPAPGIFGWSQEGYGVPTLLPDEIRIRVTVHVAQAEGSIRGCRTSGDLLVTVLETTVSEADLAAARAGIRLTSPADAPFPVVVVVRLD